ncbi:methylitaconate delta2-delta3-isomerase [Bradyrhizobium guangdongense]|nr:methylitaconate delta2-delta3-isomerase [Bradyrhizobium guangdongense]
MGRRFEQHNANVDPVMPSAMNAGGGDQIPIRCTFMRGGSSRGGVFLDDDLPQDEVQRAAVLLAAYGSPDDRQIDGIGGADPLTSKAAVVKLSSRPDAEIEYTFYQVGIDNPSVSTGGNCGNMLAAVGPFAIRRGLIDAVEPETIVRIYNTNTRQVVVSRIPVRDGEPLSDGDCAIAGVPDTGAPIRLDFGNCAGAVSGKLLPTGRAREAISIDGKTIEVSLIDAATPFVFVNAVDVGAVGTESPDALRINEMLMSRLEQVRGWAAVKLGLVTDQAEARTKSPNIPRVIMVSPPRSYSAIGGHEVAASDIDICVRQLAMQRPHKALAVTGAVCTAVACSVPNSVVAAAIGKPLQNVRLGHPSGVLRVASSIAQGASGPIIESAQIERTARIIMDGAVYIRRRKFEELAAALARKIA